MGPNNNSKNKSLYGDFLRVQVLKCEVYSPSRNCDSSSTETTGTLHQSTLDPRDWYLPAPLPPNYSEKGLLKAKHRYRRCITGSRWTLTLRVQSLQIWSIYGFCIGNRDYALGQILHIGVLGPLRLGLRSGWQEEERPSKRRKRAPLDEVGWPFQGGCLYSSDLNS